MEQSILTAGFAKVDITPPLGTTIGGYFKERITKGVLDPLFARAIAFGDGDKSAVLLVLDLCALRGESADNWPVHIAEHLSLPREAVFVCCTHSHTAPNVTTGNSDPQYDAWLLRRLCDAGRMALDDRKEVLDVKGAQRDTEGLTYSRRYRMKDGAQMGNPPAKNWEEVLRISHPLGNVDRTLRLVRILRKDAPEIIVINFQSSTNGNIFFTQSICSTVCFRHIIINIVPLPM